MARTLQTSLRQSDISARFGGKEFVMGLPHTALQGALRVAPIWAPRCFGSAAMVRRVLHTHVSVKVGGVPSSNDGDIVLGWALDGHGILIRSEWDLAKYLESGRLRVVLPQFKLPSADLFVYYSQRRNQTARALSSTSW